MTAKFEAFKAELLEMCQRHGVKLVAYGYDSADIYVDDLGDGEVLDLDIGDDTRGTDEELAAGMTERLKQIAEQERQREEYHRSNLARILEATAARRAELLQNEDYASLDAFVQALAQDERRKQMRISTDPTDPAYLDDRPRRAWVNDREIESWIVADEFRRVVITADQVYNGAVRIERLSEVGEPAAEPAPEARSDITGMFVATPGPKPEAPKAEVKPQPNPVPKFSPKAGKHRK